MHAAFDLTKFFGGSVYEHLDRDADEVMNLHREALVWIRQRKADAD